MNILILLKLLAAHIVGDFFLQTDKICEGKYAKGARRLGYLAIHSGINALLAWLFAALWECWQIPVIVFYALSDRLCQICHRQWLTLDVHYRPVAASGNYLWIVGMVDCY